MSAASASAKEKSGAQWVSKFPGSASVEELEPVFRAKTKLFLDAIRAQVLRLFCRRHIGRESVHI